MVPALPARITKPIALLTAVVLTEHGYHWLTAGSADPQAAIRFAYYCLRCPELMLFCTLGALHYKTKSGLERTIGLYTCFLAFTEAVLTEAGGLADYGQDVQIRGWSGRFVEVCGPFAIQLLTSATLAGILTGAFNRKEQT